MSKVKFTVEVNPQKEVVDLALGFLYDQRVHPDVGMGFWADTAVDLAIKQLVKKYGTDFKQHIDRQAAVDETDKQGRKLNL